MTTERSPTRWELALTAVVVLVLALAWLMMLLDAATRIQSLI